jgi:hypothetical protein
MSPYQHHVTGFFVKRAEAEIARTKLVARGLPQENLSIYDSEQTSGAPAPDANSNVALKGLLVDGAIGTAVGAGLGGQGELALVAANVTLFVASPLLAPLVMLGWGASLGAVVGAVAGAVNSPKKDGKLADLVDDAIRSGQVVLVATTRSAQETHVATEVIQDAVGSCKDTSMV